MFFPFFTFLATVLTLFFSTFAPSAYANLNANSSAETENSFEFQDELTVMTFHADKTPPSSEHPILANILWLPSEQGVLPEEIAYAKQLAAQQFNVWMPNFFDSYFLPTAPSSLKKISPKTIQALIRAQHQAHQDIPTFVITSNQSAGLALKSLKATGLKFEASPPLQAGVILINPNLYTHTPKVGETAEYQSIVAQTNLPIFVFQSELSPWRWQLHPLQNNLNQSGSDVFIQVLPDVRDRFYFRPDALAIETQKAQTFASQIARAAAYLAPYLTRPIQSRNQMAKSSSAPKNPLTKTKDDAQHNLDVAPHNEPDSTNAAGKIQRYQGPQNRDVTLTDLNGHQHRLKDYHGKVVLLNFWASWCPPCVHEMPSMARLKTLLKEEPFEILAANLGEAPEAIQKFVLDHPVNFPILLDPAGKMTDEWQLFAYPSSYLIDAKGQIRYALFGGYEWDQADARQKIQSLIDESIK